MKGEISFPLWVLYGLFLGGLVPSVFRTPAWGVFVSIAVSLIVCWAIDRHVRRANEKDPTP